MIARTVSYPTLPFNYEDKPEIRRKNIAVPAPALTEAGRAALSWIRRVHDLLFSLWGVWTN